MAKGTTLTRKDMKGPDKFQQASAEALDWATKHRKTIVRAAVAVVVVVVGAVAAQAVMERQHEKAGGSLYKAFDAMDGEISSVPLPGVPRPLFKTEEDKQKAVIAALESVKSEHSGTPSARTADLALGDAHLRLGEADKAIASYESFLKAAPKDDSLRFSAYQGLAFAQEAKGDLAKAAEQFDTLGKEVPAFKDQAALHRARLFERMGKVEEAKKILESFAKDFPDSAQKATATERLTKLGGPSASLVTPVPAPVPAPAPEKKK